MTRLASILSCFVWLLFSSTLLAADTGISGKVLDSEGAAIEKAHVIIRADASGKREPVKNPTLMIQTDKEGRFSATVNPGFYDVCVMADAFSPHCEKVFVEHEPVASKINLKADPEVMKRLGDRF
jgi:carboxypeptidase family protein